MKITNIIIVTFILIYFLKYFFGNNKEKKLKIKNRKILEFLKHCIFSNLIFFNFGYQVHEKAFLNISILTIIYYIILFNNEEKVLEENKNEIIIRKNYFDTLGSLSLIIVTIGILAQLPLIHEPKDYLVKIGISIFYFIICKNIVFNKNDFNSLFMTNLINFIYIILSLIFDFFITFQNNFDYDIDFPGILVLKNINSEFPFLFLMIYSILNSSFTQIVFILLLIF